MTDQPQRLAPFGDDPERAHGGIVHVDGDLAVLGDGSMAWLNGERWARNAALAQAVSNPNRMRRLA